MWNIWIIWMNPYKSGEQWSNLWWHIYIYINTYRWAFRLWVESMICAITPCLTQLGSPLFKFIYICDVFYAEEKHVTGCYVSGSGVFVQSFLFQWTVWFMQPKPACIVHACFCPMNGMFWRWLLSRSQSRASIMQLVRHLPSIPSRETAFWPGSPARTDGLFTQVGWLPNTTHNRLIDGKKTCWDFCSYEKGCALQDLEDIFFRIPWFWAVSPRQIPCTMNSPSHIFRHKWWVRGLSAMIEIYIEIC